MFKQWFDKLAADLTANAREHIKAKNFVFPGKGKAESGSYPIEDAAQQAAVRSKVHAKYPGIE